MLNCLCTWLVASCYAKSIAWLFVGIICDCCSRGEAWLQVIWHFIFFVWAEVAYHLVTAIDSMIIILGLKLDLMEREWNFLRCFMILFLPSSSILDEFINVNSLSSRQPMKYKNICASLSDFYSLFCQEFLPSNFHPIHRFHPIHEASFSMKTSSSQIVRDSGEILVSLNKMIMMQAMIELMKFCF